LRGRMERGRRRGLRDLAASILEQVGMVGRMEHYPSQLSGGEKQRVAIARALVNDPTIIFADEPTGNLDDKNSELILNILSEINNMGTTLLVATHDTRIVSKAKKHIIQLDHGQVTGGSNA
ncbi:MAG: ATP-binding cassette domain-containing protein, partial [Caldisericia bacterium]|nr:ATP-binding cassette domain-containing protein [Caldisericia bacterium]